MLKISQEKSFQFFSFSKNTGFGEWLLQESLAYP